MFQSFFFYVVLVIHLSTMLTYSTVIGLSFMNHIWKKKVSMLITLMGKKTTVYDFDITKCVKYKKQEPVPTTTIFFTP